MGGKENNPEEVRDGGGEDTWTRQVLNFHINFSSVSFTWKKIEPKGKGPCPRRRQCCCIVGDKIVLFGGTRLEREGRAQGSDQWESGRYLKRGSHG